MRNEEHSTLGLSAKCPGNREWNLIPHSAFRIPHCSPASGRRGSILILVLWIVIILGVVGLAYSAAVRAQLQSARMLRGRHMAQWAARSGVERAMAEIAQADLKSVTMDELLLDDEEGFANQPVSDTASYSLIGMPDDEGNPRYGLIDEASRLSINRASEAILLNLNGVTTEMAESLIDWRDADSDALAEGGESDYYEALANPYPVKNAAFESVRELLRVKGWGPVFEAAWPDPYKKFLSSPTDEGAVPVSTTTADSAGEASQATANSQDAAMGDTTGGDTGGGTGSPSATDTSEAGMATGDELDPATAQTLINSLTAWSGSLVTNPDGGDKVNINQASASDLLAGIPGLMQDEADAIVAFRRSQQYRSPADLLRVTRPQSSNNSGNMPVATPNNPNPKSGSQSGPAIFDLRRVGEIIDYCVTQTPSQNSKVLTGRVNINTASRTVLLALPGMTEELADEIIAEREGNGAIVKVGDLTLMNNITATQFRQLYAWVCTDSCRFHVVSQGVDAESRATVTVEAVLAFDDQQTVTVIYWREF